MKCALCGLEVVESMPRCLGCGFSLLTIDQMCGPVPGRDGQFFDEAEVLSREERTRVDAALEQASIRAHGEIAATVFRTSGPVTPAQRAFWLFNKWSLGGKANSGLLIFVALEERRVECEVGYAWEDVLDEAETGQLLDEVMLPLLKEDRIADALCAGAEAACAKLEAAIAASVAEAKAAAAEAVAPPQADGASGPDQAQATERAP